MANKKITDLTLIDAVSDGDVFPIVDDPGGTPVTKKTTRTQVLATAEKIVNKAVANGYASLGADGKVPAAQLPVTGASTSTGADGAEPGSPAAGDLFLPNNGVHIERYSGAAWVPWGPIWALTRPVNADFSWVNQGAATVTQTNGGIFISAPGTAGLNQRIRIKTAPATPYMITAMLRGFGALNLGSWGLLFRESSSGKIHSFIIGGAVTGKLTNAPGVISLRQDSPTVINVAGAYVQNNLVELPMHVPPNFMRLADDGTSRILSFSDDGYNFFPYHTIGRTDFITADGVGFFANAEDASIAGGVMLLSWKQG